MTKPTIIKSVIPIIGFSLLFLCNCGAQPTPSDSQMIPVARKILYFLDSINQQNTLGAMRETDQAEDLEAIVGEYPALVEVDLCGWNSTRWSSTYANNVQNSINQAKHIWKDRKAIPAMCWHWANPLLSGGRYPDTKISLSSAEFDRIVQPGTYENQLLMADLKKHSDYLQQIADEDIPLIWRPLHEIDGGWFWWTDMENPQNTVKLWKIVYNYLVHERGFHNLIWIWNAGVGNPQGNPPRNLEWRRAFYPGGNYCDIVGIDLYGWDFKNSGVKNFYNSSQTYSDAYEMIKQACPGKLISLAECEAMPNVEKTVNNDANFPRWLWAMPWYCNNDENPKSWVSQTYTNEYVLMQPDLPDFQASACASVDSVEIVNIENYIIQLGSELELSKNVYPYYSCNRYVIWSSSNFAVAEIDSVGLLKTKQTGETTVKVLSTEGSNQFDEVNFQVVNPFGYRYFRITVHQTFRDPYLDIPSIAIGNSERLLNVLGESNWIKYGESSPHIREIELDEILHVDRFSIGISDNPEKSPKLISISGSNDQLQWVTLFQKSLTESELEANQTYLFTNNVVTGLGIKNDDVRLKVFPNPSNGRIHIRFNSMVEGDLSLFDLNGIKRWSSLLSNDNQTFDLEVPAGMYIMQISAGESNTFEKLLIVENDF